MGKKKSVSIKKKKRFAAEKKLSTKEMGFFQRLKDVLPEQRPIAKETVRVKTYIVEKPVYINAGDRGRVSPPPQKYGFRENGKKLDSRKSRYSKRKIQEEIAAEEGQEEFNDEGLTEQDEMSAGEMEGEGALSGEENFEEDAGVEGQALEGEEGEFDENADSMPGEEDASSHHRSRVMFNGVWWKRALFWGILAWLLVLGMAVVLKTLGLIDLNPNRQWWVFLGIIIFISLIYHAFFADKHLI